jgi:lipoate-protein ligase A
MPERKHGRGVTHMAKWRLIDLGTTEPLMAQTFYEAVAHAVDNGSSPDTMILVQPSAPYVCLGYHQELEKEIDLSYCRSHNLMVIRRSQGGGATYLDNDQLFYQVIAKEDGRSTPFDLRGIFKRFLAVTVHVYRSIGLPAEFKALNDVIVHGRKISGNGAGTYGAGTFILVGNIILDLDYGSMSHVLRVPNEKFRDKMAKSMQEWVTSIKREAGSSPPIDVVKRLLVEGYRQVLGIDLVPARPSDEERVTWEREVKPRHLSDDWLYMPEFRHRDLVDKRAIKVAGGIRIVEVEHKAMKLIRVTAELSGEEVRDIMFSGDFFILPEHSLPKIELALRGAHLDRDSIFRRISDVYRRVGIRSPGISPGDFADAVMKLVDT